MKKRNKIIYLVATILLTVNMLFSAGMYFFKHEMVVDMFSSLSYPSHIIYPLAVAKILGLIAIWSNKSKMLKEWAYAGFVFEIILAISAHLNAGDGGALPAAIALILVLVSYSFYRIGLSNKLKYLEGKAILYLSHIGLFTFSRGQTKIRRVHEVAFF